MKNTDTDYFRKPKIFVLGKQNPLTEKAIEKLLKEEIETVYFTVPEKADKISSSLTTVNIQEINSKELQLHTKPDYLLAIFNGCDEDDLTKYLTTTLNIIGAGKIKTVVTLPFSGNKQQIERNEEVAEILMTAQSRPALMYSGEFVEDRDSSGVGVFQLLKNFYQSGRLHLNRSAYHYPSTVDAFVEQVFYNLFSFGSCGQKTAVVGEAVGEEQIAAHLKIKHHNLVVEEVDATNTLYAKVDEKIYVKVDVDKWLDKIIDKIETENIGSLQQKRESQITTGNTSCNELLAPQQDNGSTQLTAENPAKQSDKQLTRSIEDSVNTSQGGAGETIRSTSEVNKYSNTDKGVEGLSPKVFDLKKVTDNNPPLPPAAKAADTHKAQRFSVDEKEGRMGFVKKAREKLVGLIPRKEAGHYQTGLEKGTGLSAKKKVFYLSSLAFIVLVLFPVISLGLGIMTLTLSTKTFAADNISGAKRLASMSGFFSEIGRGYFAFYNELPFVNRINKQLYLVSDLTVKNSKAQTEGIGVVEISNKIILSVFSDNAYDIEKYSQELAVGLYGVYKNLSFLSGNKNQVPLAKNHGLFTKANENERRMLLSARSLALKLPEILGKGKPATYLVLLQNSTYAKPSGGDIQEVALVTFSNGKLINKKTLPAVDVVSTIGVVEPPEAIKNYFGKQNWELNDVNWFSDFQTTAEKAAWLVDRVLDVKVDGVIAINADYGGQVLGTTVDSKDVANEVKMGTGFWMFGEHEAGGSASLLRALVQGVVDKNILMWFEDGETQRIVGSAGLGGLTNDKYCIIENCLTDTIGIVENQFVETPLAVDRVAEVSVVLEEGLIKRNIMYFIDNSKNNVPYKTYIKAIAGEDVGFSPVVVVSSTSRERIGPEVTSARGYKEAGVFLTVEAGESKALMFSWEGPNSLAKSDSGRYELFWYKQPGISFYPVSVNLFSGNLKTKNSNLSLTQDGVWAYNTTLSQDLKLFFEW
jgi:hypothetical protein